ncbi:molybdopterin-guanine dinucleotide biosynthesis protein B [Fictibacillus macauensis ZFHKF-1]|uniref:Molybdopterin-guanine dinucleotide biosynthesis protein B n=1 Tax=Fictibacillus macauensis ZFHKF-1 TaxID=1196324 RepID=I8UCR3_9BACL|nr:molybdopterin-guanine dinucleotide biosynthesis protein B [Fictibacillus macauensis]EIT84573.1 molybdopterin-guanine dinucleotide biosynthesis protein B [Fictibacillus macauensis ZFHKF-1]
MDSALIQVVGYKDSGKTTVISSLLQAVTQKGYTCGTIKHHGHGTVSFHDEGRDTFHHREAGAIISTIEGGGKTEVCVNKSLTLAEMLHMYTALSLDVIFIEGYKKNVYPRIVIIKTEEDWSLLSSQTIAVLYWSLDVCKETHIPCFHIDDQASYSKHVITYLRSIST